jgi:hypothetical protein
MTGYKTLADKTIQPVNLYKITPETQGA